DRRPGLRRHRPAPVRRRARTRRLARLLAGPPPLGPRIQAPDRGRVPRADGAGPRTAPGRGQRAGRQPGLGAGAGEERIRTRRHRARDRVQDRPLPRPALLRAPVGRRRGVGGASPMDALRAPWALAGEGREAWGTPQVPRAWRTWT